MFRWACAGCCCAVFFTTAPRASAADPVRFRWKTGEVLTYRITEKTSVVSKVEDKPAETRTLLALTKRWQVLGVDAAGVGTLQLSVPAMSFEMQVPGTDQPLRYDSADPEKSTPELRQQMGRYVGTPLALLRIDPLGRVVEVKKSEFGPAEDYQTELPFLLTLPAEGLSPGKKWQRTYRIVLAPPKGTGETYDAAQTYACARVIDGRAVVKLTTALASPPEAGEQVPLLQHLPEGEAVFDLASGRLVRAALKVDRQLKDHPTPGSEYAFRREYTLEAVPGR